MTRREQFGDDAKELKCCLELPWHQAQAFAWKRGSDVRAEIWRELPVAPVESQGCDKICIDWQRWPLLGTVRSGVYHSEWPGTKSTFCTAACNARDVFDAAYSILVVASFKGCSYPRSGGKHAGQVCLLVHGVFGQRPATEQVPGDPVGLIL